MYKRLSLDDLLQVQTGLFDRLGVLCKKYNHQYLQGFLQEFIGESRAAYFFRDNKPALCFFRESGDMLRIVDETESLEIVLGLTDLGRLHNILKDKKTMIQAQKQQSVFDELLNAFMQGELNTFADKPFLVYDIETTMDEATGEQIFAIAYMIDSAADHSGGLQYTYIAKEDLPAFAQYLLDYPGWIIGFNQLSFDNPITMTQAGLDSDALAIVQGKSLDPFQLIRSLTGKRMSLQAMATALLGAGKTLSSGTEGQSLLEKRQKHGDAQALEKVKQYCKNDVHITLGVFLYLLSYQDIYLEGNHYMIDQPIWHTHATFKNQATSAEIQTGFF